MRWERIPDVVTPEEAATLMARIKDELGGDWEAAHHQADDVLCALLRFYGQHEIVQAFDSLDKWYA